MEENNKIIKKIALPSLFAGAIVGCAFSIYNHTLLTKILDVRYTKVFTDMPSISEDGEYHFDSNYHIEDFKLVRYDGGFTITDGLYFADADLIKKARSFCSNDVKLTGIVEINTAGYYNEAQSYGALEDLSSIIGVENERIVFLGNNGLLKTYAIYNTQPNKNEDTSMKLKLNK